MKLIAKSSAVLLGTCLCGASAFTHEPATFITKSITTQKSDDRHGSMMSSGSPLRMSLETSKTDDFSIPNPFNLLANIFQPKFEEEEKIPKIPDVVIDSDYNLAYAFAAIGILITLTSPDGVPSFSGLFKGGIHIFLAAFFAVQAKRIRFVFDETSFELKNVDLNALPNDEVMEDSGENFVVGGANRWTYDSFVNWDFFPSIKFPILVYFKETQTPQEQWNEGPGQFDKAGGGQIHFFPAIANCEQLQEQFTLRGCAKMEQEA